jgi:hypothetical protein
MLFAAICGQTLTCAYLHAEGCPWDAQTIATTMFANQWDTVRWMREHGCPWNFGIACLAAAHLGSIDGMTYLLQQEDVSAYDLTQMLNAAGSKGHLAAAQWLRQRGAEWSIQLYNWPDGMIAWARAEGCDSSLHF